VGPTSQWQFIGFYRNLLKRYYVTVVVLAYSEVTRFREGGGALHFFLVRVYMFPWGFHCPCICAFEVENEI
jgi:hypothetical protein